MGLKNVHGVQSLVKHSWIVVAALGLFLLAGCGVSEEAATDETAQSQAVKPQAKPEQEKPKEEKPNDDALTSFVGPESDKPAEPTPAPVATASPAQLAQYEKQIDDLRTENTALKQKVVKLEEENRSVNARLGGMDSMYAAEKLRADVAARAVPVPTEQPVPEEKSIAVTSATYDNALKAFKARKYDEAAKGFKALVNAGGNPDLVNRSRYWLGESYFAKKKYKEALPLFQETVNAKSGEKKADAQFMLAQTYEKLGSKAKAKAAYEKVVKNYPMSKNVKRAKERWAKL